MVINGLQTTSTMTQEELKEIAEEHHRDMVSLGWSDHSKSNEHYLMLTIGEIGEAMQSHRRGLVHFKHPVGLEFLHEYIDDPLLADNIYVEAFEFYVKDSVADEMADALLRILEHIKMRGYDYLLDLEESPLVGYDSKPLFSENGFTFSTLCTSSADMPTRLWKAMWFVIRWAKNIDIDLLLACRRKMRYNRLRNDWQNHEKKY